jgi:hypothetical protein
LLAHCGCEPAGSLAPVRGKVSFKGVPLTTGTIVFTPDPLRGTTGPVAHGAIQVDGAFVLHTDGQVGAAAGWHRVTLVALEGANVDLPDGQFVIPRSLLPERYRDPELSGLVREVKAGQENVFDFDLE